jgi:hypothetical protein
MPSLMNGPLQIIEPGSGDTPPTSLINRATPLAPPPTLADAWDVTGPALAQNARDTWAAVKDPQTWQDAAHAYAGAMLAGSVGPEGGLAARMARAKAMGFDTDRTLYHATSRDFDAFRLNMAGSGSNAGNVEKAVFLTSDPKVAETYLPQTWVNAQSPQAIEALGRTDAAVAQYFQPGSQIMPVHIRNPDDFEVWDMGGGGYTPDFMRQALKEAKQNGAPGVIFQNMADPGIGSLGRPKVSDIYAVFKPSDIRGKFADFDPAKAKSGKLTAGVAGTLAAGAGAAAGGGQDQQ